jgi:lipopolysaccharide transport system permease protein
VASVRTLDARGGWLPELWRYRELFYFLVWRDVKVRYKQTVLGMAWAIIQPFFAMVVFTIFFRKLAGMPSDGIPYPIFSYSALLPWIYFSQTITHSGNSVVGNRELITKVYFPRATIPASSAFSGLLDFAIASVVLLGMMVYYRIPPTASLLLWGVLVIPLLMLALGVGMFFAALNVRYRDIKYALPFFVQLWLFITPVIYPTSIIPKRFRTLFAMNPLSGLIEAFRASLLPSRTMDWHSLGISLAITVVIFATGTWYFRKTERTFADIV